MHEKQTSHFATDEEGRCHHVYAKVSRTGFGSSDFSCREDEYCGKRIFERKSMSSYPLKIEGNNHGVYNASRRIPKLLQMNL